MADALAQAPGVPPADAIQADLAACEALVAAGRIDEAEQRLETCEGAARSARPRRPTGASSCASAGSFASRPAGPQPAHHDFAQSANIFELLGERYQAALSQLALGRIAAAAGSRPAAERYLDSATDGVHDARRPARPRRGRERARSCSIADAGHAAAGLRAPTPTKASSGDWSTRRSFPSCSSRETATALLEATEADAVVVFVESPTRSAHRRERRLRRQRRATTLARCRASRQPRVRRRRAARRAARQGSRRATPLRDRRAAADWATSAMRRFRMFAAIARQGFELCGAARTSGAGGRTGATSGRSSRCCPASSAPARR